MSATDTSPGAPVAQKPSRIWLWVLVAFAVQFAAWTAWFIIAAHHQVEEVPLATATAPERGN